MSIPYPKPSLFTCAQARAGPKKRPECLISDCRGQAEEPDVIQQWKDEVDMNLAILMPWVCRE